MGIAEGIVPEEVIALHTGRDYKQTTGQHYLPGVDWTYMPGPGSLHQHNASSLVICKTWELADHGPHLCKAVHFLP